MSVKINGHTIASKLRKMFSSNGQTVATNLDGEIPSGDSSGSGGALIVTMTQDVPGSGLAWNSETTYGEVYEAMLAGRPVFIKCEGDPINSGGGPYNVDPIYQVIYAAKDSDDNVTIRIPDFVDVSHHEIAALTLYGSYDNAIEVSYYD